MKHKDFIIPLLMWVHSSHDSRTEKKKNVNDQNSVLNCKIPCVDCWRRWNGERYFSYYYIISPTIFRLAYFTIYNNNNNNNNFPMGHSGNGGSSQRDQILYKHLYLWN